LTLASCGPSYSSSQHRYRGAPGYPNGATHPSSAQQAATIAANQGYRHVLLVTAERFTSSVRAIARSAGSGDLAGARRSELDAQAAYDVLRAEIAPQSATAVQLDGESWSTPAGRPSGLHAIERALWTDGDLSAVQRRASALAAASLITGFVFYRLNLTPAQILARAQIQLAWAVNVAVQGREEQYSHFDAVDVIATAKGAERAFDLVAPLGRLVAPDVTATVSDRFRALDEVLTPLGPRGGTADAVVAVATWRSIAAGIDAVAAPIGTLTGAVTGFGSGRVYA
jgi:hypothetical protein